MIYYLSELLLILANLTPRPNSNFSPNPDPNLKSKFNLLKI